MAMSLSACLHAEKLSPLGLRGGRRAGILWSCCCVSCGLVMVGAGGCISRLGAREIVCSLHCVVEALGVGSQRVFAKEWRSFQGRILSGLGWCCSLGVLAGDGVIVSDIFPRCGDRLAAVLASGP